MHKLTTLAILAGLATVSITMPGYAQVRAVPGGPSSSDTHSCADEVGQQRRVSASQIDDIQGQKVWLSPVCEDNSMMASDDYGSLFLDGNANTLRDPIADNATLMAALTAKGYDQNDVVSVVFGANDSVLLYVHQRDVR